MPNGKQRKRQRKKRDAQTLRKKEKPIPKAPRRRWYMPEIPVDGERWAEKLTSTQLKAVNMYIEASESMLKQGYTTGDLLELIHTLPLSWEQYYEAFPNEAEQYMEDKTSPYQPPPSPPPYSSPSTPPIPPAIDDHGNYSLNPGRILHGLIKGDRQKKKKKKNKTKKKKNKIKKLKN